MVSLGMVRRLVVCVPRGWLVVVAVALLVAAPRNSTAQDDPFASPMDPFGTPMDPFGTPMGAAAAPSARAPVPVAPAEREEVETDPVVLGIRDTNPTTPEQLMRAARIMLDYGRLDVAREYLERLAAVDMAPDVLNGLYNRFGEAFFVRLAREQRLAPESHELARRVLAAAADAARDPNTIVRLVEATQDPVTRTSALGTLRGRGTTAVPTLLKMLASADQSKHHRTIQNVLVSMPLEATDALLAAFESSDDAFRKRLIPVIVARRDHRATVELIGMAYDPESSDELRGMAAAALRRLNGEVPGRTEAVRALMRDYGQRWTALTDDAETAERRWTWDAADQTVAEQTMSVALAQREAVQRVAELLVQIEPQNERNWVYKLAADLELAQFRAGLTMPLPGGDGSVRAAVSVAEPSRLNEVLAYALETNRVAAAIGAAQVLGEIGGVAQLLTSDGGYSPLAQALHHPQPLVQAAAVDAIMQIQPTEAFPGAGRFRELLGQFLRSSAPRRVLIATPRQPESQILAGLLGQLGYESDWAATGKDALGWVKRHQDYELVLVSDALAHPAADEMIQMLRQLPNGGSLPVAVMIRDLPVNMVGSRLLPEPPEPSEPVVNRAPDTDAAERNNGAAPDADGDAAAGGVVDGVPPSSDAAAPQAPDGSTGAFVGAFGTQLAPPFEPLSTRQLHEIARYREWKYEKYRNMAYEDPYVVSVPRPHSVEGLQVALQRASQLPGRATVPPEDRVRRSHNILVWIASTLDSPAARLYELLWLEEDVARLVFDPTLSAAATRVLGLYATPRSQQLLVDAASQPTLDVETRKAAAAAFAEAVGRRGVLLTTGAILEQYDRYNASESMDRATQEILGNLLDTIESRSPAAPTANLPEGSRPTPPEQP